MCGIAGGWWSGHEAGQAQRLHDALRIMHHRGPDDNGQEFFPVGQTVVGLGHTRLSIIDLSAAGHQPMHTPDGDLSIVFNGEIYNYRELRKELEQGGVQFHSDSDTEVLLHAWRRWGVPGLRRLTGMFAFTVLDRRRNTLTCVRDAFGIKPFFYTTEPGSFLFASEVTAVKALKQQRVQLDWQRAYDYLVHADYDSNEATFFRDVRHLLPGHFIEVSLETGVVGAPQAWWTPTLVQRTNPDFGQACEQVRELFLDSIRLHLRSDVPLGAALSGGIDSSAVVCAMRHVEPDLPVNTFSFVARGSAVSEEHWIDRVNQVTGARPHKVVATGHELVRDLDDLIRVQGEPFGSTSMYAQYRVFQLARSAGVTVTLDGQGADEMLAGYKGYPGQRLRSLLETGHLVEAGQFLHQWAQWPDRHPKEAISQLLAECVPEQVYAMLRRIKGATDVPDWLVAGPLREAGVSTRRPWQPAPGVRGRRVIAELAQSLTRRGLPGLLRHGDRNSMRFSVESRVPFLTLELVELLLSLPEHYLISPQGATKHVFREAMRGIVPDDVLDRRDKLGFAAPEQVWLLEAAEAIRTCLADDLELPFLDQKRIRVLFEEVAAGRQPFSWQVWRWVNFCRWYRLNFA